jgi:1,4-alpha-glucan branching enzyme
VKTLRHAPQGKQPSTRDLLGSLVFVLHCHLPFVLTHGRWPHGLDWLNEAAAETYIPLLNVLNDLADEGFSPKITVGITPVLAEQLSSSSFKEEFISYLDAKLQAAKADRTSFRGRGEDQLARTAQFWIEWYSRIKDDFQKRYRRDLIAAFRRLDEGRHIEIITCGATHGYFPLLSLDTSIQAQIKVAVATHRRHFGVAPRGIWLPECAYRPAYVWRAPVGRASSSRPYHRKGVEEFLAENGIEYFFIDSALLRGGKAIGVYIDRFEGLKRIWKQFQQEVGERAEDFSKSPYELYLVNSSGAPEKKPVGVFTRDPRTALQVWSGEHGYPGDGWYLDFHKKHFPGGHRYWRVTSAKADLADKRTYEREKVDARLEENADHFVHLVREVLREHFVATGRRGVLTAPFDAELFGHWWFEGPDFLKKVVRKVHEMDDVQLATASDEYDRQAPSRVIALPEGSWGEGGHHYIWLNKETEWTWKHIYEAERRMRRLARRFADTKNPRRKRVAEQLARELLLLQASDWQFLISTISAKDYAETRFAHHYSDFRRLADIAERLLESGRIDSREWNFVEEVMRRDSLFPELDVRWWLPVHHQ